MAQKKTAAKRAKGPDNNKRLAELEAKEAARTRPAEDDTALMLAYQQGRAARRGRISRDEPPHGEGPPLKAWQKGYDDEEDAGG